MRRSVASSAIMAAVAVDGFAYCEAFRKGLSDKSWDAALLDRWLAEPQTVAPRSVMPHTQEDADQRALLIQFLESLH